MKKITSLIICCILILTGCGNIKISKELIDKNDNKENSFNINKKDLELKGYKNIDDIAYGKINETKGKTTVFLIYCKNEPRISLYLATKIMQLLDNNANLLITWDGKDYDISEEKMNETAEGDFKSLFPSAWHEVIEKTLSSESGIGDFVSESLTDEINKSVESFVYDYLEKSTLSIISQKEYEIDGEKISISLEENNGKIEITVWANAKTEEKACLMLTVLKTSFDKLSTDGYNITILCGKLSVSYIMIDEEIYISGNNKDGSFTLSMPDWVVSEFSMSEEEINSYASEILMVLKDFGETTMIN